MHTYHNTKSKHNRSVKGNERSEFPKERSDCLEHWVINGGI
jgi:hypothetical protein